MFSIRQLSLTGLFAFTLFTTSSFAQLSYLDKANKALQYKDFASATASYEDALKDEPNNATALAKLAQCYTATYKYDKAAATYVALLAQPAHSSDDVFNYARLLHLQGKYDEAETQYNDFAKTNPKLGAYFAEACSNSKAHLTDELLYALAPAAFNTSAADFAPTFYGKNQVVFTSTRSDANQKASLTRLWISTADEKSAFAAAKLEKNPINPKDAEGFAAFDATSTQAVFVRNSVRNGVSPLPIGGSKHDLFFANVKAQGSWTDVKGYESNNAEYSLAYPYLNDKGDLMIFASDMIGGSGGYDLYYAQKVGNIWTAPVNMGTQVNTAGDEITPFVEDGKLFFASDFLQGFGGFDIYSVDIDMKTKELSNLLNLGISVNSSYDDFGYIYDKQRNYGFISSNRSGGKSMEDIYKIVRKQQPIALAGKAIKTTTLAKPTPAVDTTVTALKESLAIATPITTPIVTTSDATTVEAKAAAGAQEKIGTTDLTKKTALPDVPPNSSQQMMVQKYAAHTIPNTILKGFVLDEGTGEPLSGAVVSVTDQNNKTAGATTFTTDEDGQYSVPLQANAFYWIQYSKAGFVEGWRQLRTTARVPADILGYFRLKPSATNLKTPPMPPAPPRIGVNTNPALLDNPVKNALNTTPETVDKVTETAPTTTTTAASAPVTTVATELNVGTKAIATNITAPIEKATDVATATVAATQQTAYEIIVLTTKKPLEYEAQEALRRNGSLYTLKKENDFITYKLGLYDNIDCATTTRDKVRGLGYKQAHVEARDVEPQGNVEKMRLTLGKQKAICPAEKPIQNLTDKPTDKTITTVAPPAAPPSTTPIKDKAESPAGKPILAAAVQGEPQEGDIVAADPYTAAKIAEDDGFRYFIQLVSVQADKKVTFAKINKLKLGTIKKVKNASGSDVYMLGSFPSLIKAREARRLCKETGEVGDPFVLKYDKEGKRAQ